jgi:phosphatidylglycerophosphate synthase
MAAAVVALGATRGDALLLWGGLVGLVASFLVSYARAKAESLGVSATVGVAPREARLVVFLTGLGLSAVFGSSWLFAAAVVAVALLSTLTLLQRIAHVARALR